MTYTFKDLYDFSDNYIQSRLDAGESDIYVPVTTLIREISKNVTWLDKVKVQPIKDTSRTDKVWGMYERLGGQDPYEAMCSDLVIIAYGDWQNKCYKRFVCAKELLHVFDGIDAQASNAEEYSLLTGEIEDEQDIETRPLIRSPRMQSEVDAQWKALLVLCPKSQREKIVQDSNGNDYAWAIKYSIPEIVIDTIRSPRYDRAFNLLFP